MAKNTKVYILGAGCSVDYGYPLGNGFRKELETFGNNLKASETQQIKQAVENTVQLLTPSGIPTRTNWLLVLTTECSMRCRVLLWRLDVFAMIVSTMRKLQRVHCFARWSQRRSRAGSTCAHPAWLGCRDSLPKLCRKISKCHTRFHFASSCE